MDALSGVASGMAVASLSLQLIQSISTINTFIRAVKGAPKELERLVESLERLRAILNDICQLMELQTSRSSHGIPMPSMTIFNCLKSCEHQLRPLQSLVDRYGNNHSQDRSKSGKLWDSVTMGFKTKDILGFEARIQQEMTNLTTALIMNSTSIQ
jgi:signal transduction histidine kinase